MSRTAKFELANDFNRIKHDFFHCWDRQNLWRIRHYSRRRVHGHCDRAGRIIEIVTVYSDPDERDRLLIHEICHAVALGSHGVIWQRRMEKAAKTAHDLGRNRLAHLLSAEIPTYKETGSVVAEVYDSIRDAVNLEPDLSLRQIRRWLASEYGLMLSEVDTTFKRMRKVFQAAQWEARQRGRKLRELDDRDSRGSTPHKEKH